MTEIFREGESKMMSKSSKSSTCPVCNGNDCDMPCAYPTERLAGCLRESEMDQFTQQHLDRWLINQFDIEQALALRQPMTEIYESDPDFWAGAGWWKVYDEVRGRIAF